MQQRPPDGYEEKFAGFIRACAQAKAKGIPNVIIAQPQTLGDTSTRSSTAWGDWRTRGSPWSSQRRDAWGQRDSSADSASTL